MALNIVSDPDSAYPSRVACRQSPRCRLGCEPHRLQGMIGRLYKNVDNIFRGKATAGGRYVCRHRSSASAASFHFSAIEHIPETGFAEYRRDGGPGALVAPNSVAVRYRIPRRKREHSEQVVFPSGIFLSQCRRCFFDDFIFYAQLLKVGWQDMFRTRCF